MSYKITKVSVKNFKLFGDEGFEVSFDSDLIVFDGPNGFGKTTIFDALELIFTGNIRRLVSVENRQIPTDVVVAHHNSSDVVVSCTLKEEFNDRQIVISRELKNPLPPQSTKINNFKALWDTYIQTDGEKRLISQDELNTELSTKNLEHNYSMFYYIEQEDTFHFLKSNTETDRAKALSHLLGDTTEVETQISKLHLAEKRVGKISQDLQKDLDNLKKNISSDTQTANQYEESQYSKLNNWDDVSYDWDKEELSKISPQERDAYIWVMLSIAQLVKHKEAYLARLQYDYACKQDNILKSFLLHSNHLKDYQHLKESYQKYHRLEISLRGINSSNFKNIKVALDDHDFLDIIDFELKDEFKISLNTLLDLEAKSSGLGVIYTEIISYRKALIKASLRANKDDDGCLLCGTSFHSSSSLHAAFAGKEKNISKLLSNDDKSTAQLADKIRNRFLEPIAQLIEENMKVLFLDETFIKSLDEAYKERDRLERLSTWMNREGIETIDLVSTNNDYSIHEVENYLLELKGRILSKRPEVDHEYLEADEHYNFDNVYQSIFSRKKNNLLTVSFDEIENKRNYIETSYRKAQNTHLNQIEQLGKRIALLDKERKKIQAIKNVYKQEISKYRKKLIKDIEIPFYIYSSKILQSHQVGGSAGIFIKDKTGGEELKNIRFVFDWSCDHDILNMMSSGQISAIVISFFLALNKVYSTGVDMFLIDDPVHTMDEINMISLVEILRNEFSNLQIVLSSHEPDIAKYFLYKFLKFGKTATQVNMMKREEYLLPSNREMIN